MASKMSLKLLVDKKKNKVLFAESGKEFVDFLFSLLTMPIGTVVRLLTPTHTSTGSIGNIYSSVDDLDSLYMQPNVDKSPLLQPQIGPCGNEMQMLLMQSDSQGKGESQSNEVMKPIYYGCAKLSNQTPCGNYVTNVVGALCKNCGGPMNYELEFLEGQGSTVANGGGYVKEVVTYTITDDLVVKPMSTISSITMLNKCDVQDIGALEDRVVHFGTKEGLNLLRASLMSKSVLTDVFLNKGIKFDDNSQVCPTSPPKTCPTE